MNKVTKIAALVVAAGLAAPSMAQDSVSSNGAGDALSPWSTGDVCTSYVVDLSPLTTSWGTEFGIAPVLKGTRSSSMFLNNLFSAHAISAQLADDGFGGSFDVWNTAGAGINEQNNTMPGSIGAPASAFSFGIAASDFGTTDSGQSFNGVISARVQIDPDDPTRLYVERLHAASNSFSSSEDRSQFGGMSVDVNGDTLFRSDNNNGGSLGPNPIQGNNWFRVDFDARSCGTLNVIDNAGGSDAAATDWILVGNPEVHSPPNLIPGSVTGGDAIAAGANFLTQYVYGDVGSVSSTGAHLDTSAGGAAGTDHRGAVAATGTFTLGAADYTLAVLARDQNDLTRGINLWGVTSTGSIVAGTQANLIVPTSGVTDNYDGFVLGYVGENNHYFSQTAFRGGVSQVALGSNADGSRGLAAIQLASEISGPAADEWVNSIVLASFDPANPLGTAQWNVVAYCNDAGGGGKEITDGAGGVVGQLVPLIDVGATALGPSFSAPTIDAAGNVWFISSVELYKVDMDGVPFSDFDSALIRAVYDEVNSAWELELVLELGNVFTGENSGTPWQIQFMGVADSNSIGSGTMFSNAMVQAAYAGMDASMLDSSDPRTLGGVIVNADITYDTTGDGEFDEDNGDESYQAILYIGNTTPAEEPCPADQNGDGNFNNTDINLFVNNFLTMQPAADINGDGNYNNTDINLFVNFFLTQCQ